MVSELAPWLVAIASAALIAAASRADIKDTGVCNQELRRGTWRDRA
ncbi:MAG: hypothetical protein H0W30_10210 [Gemmatimonadaceae bacterium]|nr:hypothetical protein [Gemmatimonadaceae bacterium]MDQ3519150.1 hypothetical protein [Gemmatimonadota bacterium]